MANDIVILNSYEGNLSPHPDYVSSISDWEKYRYTMKGGRDYIDKYLYQYSKREDSTDFSDRKKYTYAPNYVKTSLIDIRNSLLQRMMFITRSGGDLSYTDAIEGKNGGVDLKGNTIDSFIGIDILTEMLIMKRSGVFIDKSSNISDVRNETDRPYLYMYKAEDIKSWRKDKNGQLIKLLLVNNDYNLDDYGLVTGYTRYQSLYSLEGDIVTRRDFEMDGKTELGILQEINLDTIPFHMFEISDSLLKDVVDYQIALLNMESSDINYCIKSNFPFYTEQYNPFSDIDMVQHPDTDSNSTDSGTQPSNKIDFGSQSGRRYPQNLERPGFIHPSPEPLEAGMKKEQDIIHAIKYHMTLNLSNLEQRFASADSKKQDLSAQENGLVVIGAILEHGENRIAEIWAKYQDTESAFIKYPEKYNLRTEEDVRSEVDSKIGWANKVPSKTYQRAIFKDVASLSIGNKVTDTELKTIHKEIDNAEVLITDYEILSSDLENGLVGNDTASQARGYPEGEVEKAKKDHAERIERIQQAQSSGKMENATQRGVNDLGSDRKIELELDRENQQQ